jgi:thiol-disulfide isomerase/thioredoxin
MDLPPSTDDHTSPGPQRPGSPRVGRWTGTAVPSIAMRGRFVGVVTAACLLLGACGDDGSTDGGSVELPGDDVGGATLPGLGDGATDVELAALRGRPVVVNFFASTCAPCVREMPALERVHQEAGDEVAFVGVAVNDRVDDALELVDQTGVTYELAADPAGEFFTGAGATLLPTTLVLDADGGVASRLTGEITADELVEVLAEETGVEVVLA